MIEEWNADHCRVVNNIIAEQRQKYFPQLRQIITRGQVYRLRIFYDYVTVALMPLLAADDYTPVSINYIKISEPDFAQQLFAVEEFVLLQTQRRFRDCVMYGIYHTDGWKLAAMEGKYIGPAMMWGLVVIDQHGLCWIYEPSSNHYVEFHLSATKQAVQRGFMPRIA